MNRFRRGRAGLKRCALHIEDGETDRKRGQVTFEAADGNANQMHAVSRRYQKADAVKAARTPEEWKRQRSVNHVDLNSADKKAELRGSLVAVHRAKPNAENTQHFSRFRGGIAAESQTCGVPLGTRRG